MKVIRGFTAAKAALSRQNPAVFTAVPESVRQRLLALFGTGNSEAAVRQIINEVQNRGDAALLDYTLKIDGVRITSLEVSQEQIKQAHTEIDDELSTALRLAADRIEAFYQLQKESLSGDINRQGLGQSLRPLKRVGIYAPGGTAAYPSTVLMTVIPAKVAGVTEVILTTPPDKEGAIPAATLVAADIAGASRVFQVGGAQAIAALACGTNSIPQVDKICGPGNIFVTLAKKLVYGIVDIDGLQGPSEVLIIADDTANPEYCAADLLAQAEHDALAPAILITTSIKLAEAVAGELERQLATAERQAIAREALANNGRLAIVDTLDEAVELANLYAPEHLSLMVKDAATYVERLTNAGCIFVGEDSPVAIGDYVAGPSHALPTGGTARFSSPLNILDFIKITDIINIDKATLKEIGPAAITIARAEGLQAHARAVEKRLQNK